MGNFVKKRLFENTSATGTSGGGNGIANVTSVSTGGLVANTLKEVSYGVTTSSNPPFLSLRDGDNEFSADILRPKSGSETTVAEIQIPFDLPAGLTLIIIG